jgi:quercetin dioxygenase-like cupin family protein
MMANLHVPSGAGRTFQFGTEIITLLATAIETVDRRALMYWVASATGLAANHTHQHIEETFYVIDGELEFTLGTKTVPLRTGDFVRVPPGTRHGYLNKSGRPVPMIVTLSPGDLAELFYEYRSGPGGKDLAGNLEAYLDGARGVHSTVYEIPGR